PLADANPGPFGIDDYRTSGRGRPAAFFDKRTQRPGAGRALYRDDAITPGHPAEQRNVRQLFLQHDDRQIGDPHHFHRLEHRLMLDRDQVAAGRDLAVDPDANAEHVSDQPVVELDPAQHHAEHRTASQNRY